jgi:nucleoside-diphosphate-sugar epimerase
MSRNAGKTVLVVGAGGGIGGETAAALARHGWIVRGLTRRLRPASPTLEWIEGDALDAADVRRAAEGAALIVHAANPPGYRNWDREVLPMLDHTIAAARAAGARIVLPGTVYNFGPDAFPLLREDSPQRPTTRKGAIRVEMEKRLRAAAATGVPVLILRAGDFFGARSTGNSYFSAAMIRPGAPVRWIVDLQRAGTSHAWAYLPDVAETIARLLDRAESLGAFEVFHFAGHQLAAGAMAAAIRAATGRPKLRAWPFPWPLVVALQPVVPLFREMAEMRYLWRRSIALDGARLEDFLGAALPATPLEIAVRDSLAGLGCLAPAAQSDRGVPASGAGGAAHASISAPTWAATERESPSRS